MQATASSRASATLGTRRYGLLLALIAFDVGLLLAVPLQGFALVVILDACHSATGFRALGGQGLRLAVYLKNYAATSIYAKMLA